MTRVLPIRAAALLLLMLAGPAAHGAGFIILKDGSVVQGSLLSCSDTELVGLVEPDGEERTFKREELSPESWHRIRTRTATTASSRLELGRFCLANGLFADAQAELQRAAELDESLEAEIGPLWKSAQEGQAATLLALAKGALARKNHDRALRLASQVATEFPDTAAAADAAAIVEQVLADQNAATVMQQELNQPLTDAQIDEMRESDPRYVEVHKHLKEAHDRTLRGLKEQKQSATEQHFRAAIEDYRNILRIVDKALEDEADQPVLVQRITQFRDKIVAETAEAYVNLASFFAGRSSYPNAAKTVNEGLQVLPENARLKQYREHVELLAASASGSRWRRGRE